MNRGQPHGRRDWLPAVFLLGSFALSLAILANRNIYDDEVSSSNLLPMPVGEIVRLIEHSDVHPPGMYVLSHLAYLLIPSPRWVTLLPLLCLYTGLAAFVLKTAPLIADRTARIVFLAMAALNPQLLMWGNSIRWYPWWSGIALLLLVIALQPEAAAPKLGRWRMVVSGFGLAWLFYVNYITILFSAALAWAMLFRYGRRSWWRVLCIFLLAMVLIAPQIVPFLTVHMPRNGEQRAGVAASFARLTQGLLESEAFVPWSPIGIAGALACAALLLVALFQGAKYSRRFGATTNWSGFSSLDSFYVFTLVLFLLAGLSGLGAKPRNALILVPLLALIYSKGISSMRSSRSRSVMLVILFAWIVIGSAHLLLREGLAKGSMINRPEEVLSLIKSSQGEGCSVIVTYDRVLAFYLVQKELPGQIILTPTQNALYRSAPRPAAGCSTMTEYVVRSYLGGLDDSLASYATTAEQFMREPATTRQLSYDPDAAMKRKLLQSEGAATVPDYRYVVTYGNIQPQELPLLEAKLPVFVVADGVSQPLQPVD